MKKILLLCSTLLATLFGGMFLPTAMAKADSDHVADSYAVEISEGEVKLPVPDVPNTWAYTITLKSGERVLGENINEYAFTQTGEYTLIYRLYVNGSLSDVLEETAVLQVADTQAPTITTDAYDDEYFVGDTLEILTAQVQDNFDKNLTASAELYLGEEKMTVQDGKHVFKKTGEYTLTYTAVDSAGNEGSLTYEFTVLAKAANGGGGNGLTIGLIVGGAVAVAALGAVLCVVLIKKKKKITTEVEDNEDNKEENDEN